MKFRMMSLYLPLFLVLAFELLAAETPHIAKIKGDVFVDGQKASKKMDVPFKSMVKAMKNSFAVIQYPSGSKLLIKEGEVKILHNDDIETASMLKGTVFVYVKKALKENVASATDKFRVLTPKISMGVRGTKFMAQHDDKGSYLCVCEGQVEAKSGANNFTVKKNEDLMTSFEKDASQVTKANKMMMSMAKSGFDLMGHPVP